MFIFPFITALFLVLLYFVHRRIFWWALGIELVLHIVGIYLIYQQYGLQSNRMLYTFALTGIGFILILVIFFIAIFLNHSKRT